MGVYFDMGDRSSVAGSAAGWPLRDPVRKLDLLWGAEFG